MSYPKNDLDPRIFGRYPGLSESELLIARDKLTEYAELALRIHRHVACDPSEYQRLRNLTEGNNDRTISSERSTNKPSPNT